jgi:hypothetical protein
VYSVSLQGLMLFGVLDAANRMGVTPSEFVRLAVEKELMRGGYLPKWWYTRKVGRIHG